MRSPRSRRSLPKRNRLQVKSVSSQLAEPLALDRWLVRLSHLAQFGLLLITIGSLYFTVLPLYQKAVLEEAIARKEVELQTLNRALDRTYLSVRSAAIREFHLRGTFECTTLWRQPPLPESMGGPPTPKKSDYESSFEFNTRNCLREVANLPQVVADLNPEDRLYLSELVEIAASRIDSKRSEAFARFKAAPQAITQKMANSMVLKGMRAFELEQRTKILGVAATAHERLQLAVSLEQEAAVMAFEDSVRKEVDAIKFP